MFWPLALNNWRLVQLDKTEHTQFKSFSEITSRIQQGDIDSLNPEFALYGSKNECVRRDPVPCWYFSDYNTLEYLYKYDLLKPLGRKLIKYQVFVFVYRSLVPIVSSFSCLYLRPPTAVIVAGNLHGLWKVLCHFRILLICYCQEVYA